MAANAHVNSFLHAVRAQLAAAPPRNHSPLSPESGFWHWVWAALAFRPIHAQNNGHTDADGSALPIATVADPTSFPEGKRGSSLAPGPLGRIQIADVAAIARVGSRFVDTVYRYVYFRVGAAPTAEVLTAGTFLKAQHRINSFTWPEHDLCAWLITIARNHVADHLKSSRFRLEVTTREMLGADEGEHSPEESFRGSRSNAVLLEAVHRLNPQQQECVTLRFLLGLSVADTARVMSKNEGAIKTLQYRAVRTLTRLLPTAPTESSAPHVSGHPARSTPDSAGALPPTVPTRSDPWGSETSAAGNREQSSLGNSSTAMVKIQRRADAFAQVLAEVEETSVPTPTATSDAALLDLALHLGEIGTGFRSPAVFQTTLLNQLRGVAESSGDPEQSSSA